MSAWANAMLLWSWQVLLLVAGATAVALIFRSKSAAHRHTFWLIVLAIAGALPLGNLMVDLLPDLPRPAVRVPIPETFSAPVPSTTLVVIDSGHEPAAMPTVSGSPPLPARYSASTVAFWLWITGMAFSVATVIRHYFVYRRYRGLATRPGVLQTSRGSVRFGYSKEVPVPVLVGFLHPMILLPDRIDEWMPHEERSTVMLHELAHYERRDHWVNLVQLFVRSVLFFHPAVRYAARQLVLERELACDERVVRAGASPAAYQDALLKVAERQLAHAEFVSPAMNATARILDRRLKMIRKYSQTSSPRWFAFSLLRFAAVVLLGILLLPEPVLRSQTPVTASPPRPVTQAPATRATPAQNRTVRPAQPSIPVQRQAPLPQPLQSASPTVAAVALGGGIAAGAQNPNSNLSGKVMDLTGAVIPGVTVQLTRPRIDSTRGEQLFISTVTNGSGAYTISIPESGEFTLQATLPGFTTYRRPVELRPGVSLTQDVLMHIAAVETFVEISTARPTAAGTTPAQSTTGVPAPTRIGGDVAAPNLITSPRPAYPPRARAANAQGTVVIQAVIGTDGSIVSAQVDATRSSSNLDLIQAALDAVKQWKYRPAILNGQPVQLNTLITLTFSLVE
jgi:TonB family protein